jgi:cyclophilin family peptidyl-prolyl cis-trans isomerase
MRALGILWALVVAASSARAEWAALVGKEPPPVSVDAWINAPEGETLEDLRGRVVLVRFWSPKDAAPSEHLNELAASYSIRGLRILALTDADALAGLEAGGLLFHVGRSGTAAAAFGGGKLPYAYLVAPDGTVAWQGQATALKRGAIEKLLRKVKPFPVRGVAEAVKPAAQAYARGRLAEAESLARQAPESDDAKYILARVEAHRAYWARQVEVGVRVGAYDLAVDALKRTKKHFKGTPAADAAAAREKKLMANPAVKNALRAATQLERLWAERLRAGDRPKALRALAKKVERFRKKFDGTPAAARARLLMNELSFDAALDAIRGFIASKRIRTSASGWRRGLPRPPKVSFTRGADYFWLLETSQGSIRVRFFPGVAPMHVSSMIYLTELGFYDGLTFHRVIPGFMAQGGCPRGNGQGDPGYLYEGEFDSKVRHDRAGLLSMANRGPDTDGSQFFITFKAARNLDDKHTIFGEVVDGMEAVRKLEELGTQGGEPQQTLTIDRARVQVRLR